MIAKNIINLFSGCLQEWVMGVITTDIMGCEVGYGISVSLYVAVHDSEKKFILDKINQYQKLRQSLHRA